MSYDNLSSVSQNVLKFYQQLTGEERGSLSFLVGTISNVLVMEIGWIDVGSGGYILVNCAHSNTSFDQTLTSQSHLQTYMADFDAECVRLDETELVYIHVLPTEKCYT